MVFATVVLHRPFTFEITSSGLPKHTFLFCHLVKTKHIRSGSIMTLNDTELLLDHLPHFVKDDATVLISFLLVLICVNVIVHKQNVLLFFTKYSSVKKKKNNKKILRMEAF